MKKCFFLIFIFWGSVTFCKAQLDITKLQKSKEYINCQLTYLYLINPQNGIAKNTNLEDLKNFVAAPAIGSSLNIEGLTNYFKSNKSIIKCLSVLWNPIDKIDVGNFDKLPKEQAAQKLVDSVFSILSKVDGGKFKTVGQKEKAELITKVSSYLTESPPQTQVGGQSNKMQDESLDMQQSNSSKSNVESDESFLNFATINIWSVIVAFVIGGFLLIYILKLKSDIDKLKGKIRKEDSPSYSSLSSNQNSTSSISISRNEFEKLIGNSTKINELADSIRKLQLDTSIKTNTQANPLDNYFSGTNKKEVVADNTFYMAGPVNNYFPISAKSDRKEGTVYKFTVKGNKQEATFELHTSGAPVKEIIGMVESYIKPACDEDNLANINAKNIITKRQGIAILEGDKWIIKTKALIRYE